MPHNPGSKNVKATHKRIPPSIIDLSFNLNSPYTKRINPPKKRKIPILYYISPQVWAWGRRRVNTIRELVDKMLVFSPFEEKLYNDAGVKVNFIGHPLLDLVKPNFSKEVFRKRLHLREKEFLIGLLPGSRWQEIKNILPQMVRSCLI